ncbi:3-hydroxyacyl-CoA dehydrogenase family protein [Nonomuraea sp. NPDC050404]|uniref:3-hydroxyacyl-CoA dehydrogenase family protein n=1 Tax=Nonomuraea sp. NPDC050404 TaxID=3155783 RepID=UPI0033DA85E3
MTSVKTVGVVGAGVMGAEVAQVLARSGHEVVLVDVTDEVLGRARESIAQSMRMQRLLAADRSGLPDREEVLSRIVFTTDDERLGAADFVIENVTENWDIKRGVYERIDRLCPQHCVFAVNTSVIPITQVGSVTRRPDRVIGTHFMNPPTLKPMVEVIRGHHTSAETVGITVGLLEAMGKQSIVVRDSPGFVTNRVLMLTVNEAMFLVHEGVATAEEVDRLFTGCFGHKMGPLETSDLIGLDTVLYSIELLHEQFGDSKYRPCPLLKTMVAAGLHGRKSGQGFYDYGMKGA